MVSFVVVELFIGSLGRSFSSVVCSLVLEVSDTVDIWAEDFSMLFMLPFR